MDPAFVYRPEFDFTLPAFDAEALASLHRFDGRRASRAWKDFDGDSLPSGARLVPERVTFDQLREVHGHDYLTSLRSSAVLAEIIELPEAAAAPIGLLEGVLLEPMRYACGGTLAAVDACFERGIVVHLSGGYHHAKREHGEGFCVWSDLALGVERARTRHGVERVMVVDLDAHQGNGLGDVFAGDETVAIFDVYNAEIWPHDEAARAGIRFEHRLASGTTGDAYLELLTRELPAAMDSARPQLVLYNAGTDIVDGDPLGGLSVPFEDVEARDRFVLDECVRRALPVVTTASGGYTDHSYRLLASMCTYVRERWLAA